jgi:hypothetical protein
MRVTLVLGILVLAGGGGLYAYRYFMHPTTLTVAAGVIRGSGDCHSIARKGLYLLQRTLSAYGNKAVFAA